MRLPRRLPPWLEFTSTIVLFVSAVAFIGLTIYDQHSDIGVLERQSNHQKSIIGRLAAENARCRSGALPSAESEDWCVDWHDWCVEKLQTCEAMMDLDAALDELEDEAARREKP